MNARMPHLISSHERAEMFKLDFLGKFPANTREIFKRVHRIQFAHFPRIDIAQSHLPKSFEA